MIETTGELISVIFLSIIVGAFVGFGLGVNVGKEPRKPKKRTETEGLL